MKTWKIKKLITLTYTDLDNNKEMEQKFICNETREIAMQTKKSLT